MNEFTKFKTLVKLQLKDKIDNSFFKKTNLLRSFIFLFIKFAVVAAVTYIFLFFCNRLLIFYYSESTMVMVLVMALTLVLSLISSTYDLMHSLYLQEDNKVLITFPVKANTIFVSKIAVFYIYEIKKNFSFVLPITFGTIILLISNHCAGILTAFWMWIPMIFITLFPVLIGALLSIPAMYVYNFIKKHAIVQMIITFIGVSLVTLFVIYLISLIPDNINLLNQWPKVKLGISTFLRTSEKKLYIFRVLVRTITGEQATSTSKCVINYMTFLRLLIIIALNGVLVFMVYFISRPVFFKMITKSTEIKRDAAHLHKNTRINKYITFVNKELKLNLRTMSISINYLLVYVIVPILILLLNQLYKVMATKYLGTMLKYTFNVLMITLPLLASNSLVATYYSSEGRAGYMKKVKPIDALIPLAAKLVFNLLFSIPSVFISCAIFGHSVGFNFGLVIVVSLAILFLHYGHTVWSAMLDIMNPQNEQYATLGTNFNNPNEMKSTVLAFVTSIVYTLLSYKIFSEAAIEGIGNKMFTFGLLKLLFISLIYFGSLTLLFIKRVKAFYYD